MKMADGTIEVPTKGHNGNTLNVKTEYCLKIALTKLSNSDEFNEILQETLERKDVRVGHGNTLKFFDKSGNEIEVTHVEISGYLDEDI